MLMIISQETIQGVCKDLRLSSYIHGCILPITWIELKVLSKSGEQIPYSRDWEKEGIRRRAPQCVATVRRPRAQLTVAWVERRVQPGTHSAVPLPPPAPQPTPVAMVRGSSARQRMESCSPPPPAHARAATTCVFSASFLSTCLPLVSSKGCHPPQERPGKDGASAASVVNCHSGKCCSISSRTGRVTGFTVRTAANQPRKP